MVSHLKSTTKVRETQYTKNVLSMNNYIYKILFFFLSYSISNLIKIFYWTSHNYYAVHEWTGI